MSIRQNSSRHFGKRPESLHECKRALEEANGDLESAVTILRKKGFSAGAKKAGRETKEGLSPHMCTTGKSA